MRHWLILTIGLLLATPAWAQGPSLPASCEEERLALQLLVGRVGGIREQVEVGWARAEARLRVLQAEVDRLNGEVKKLSAGQPGRQ